MVLKCGEFDKKASGMLNSEYADGMLGGRIEYSLEVDQVFGESE